MANSPGTAIVSVGVNYWEKHVSTQVTVQDIQSSIAQADFSNTNLVTYPNPFSNQLTITIKNTDANSLLI